MITLHGGVGVTMSKVREKFWVPRLRKLTEIVGVVKYFKLSLLLPTTRTPTKRENRRKYTFQCDRCRFCWPLEVL